MADEDELTEAERRAFAALPGETPLLPGYEDRVVGALQARGLLTRERPPGTRRMALRVGLAACLFGSGLGAGLLATRRSPDPQAGPLFLLLLYRGPGFDPGGPADERARVAEYGVWARKLHGAGQLVGAERLKDGAKVLGGEIPASPQGYFLISARDERQAEEIARDCPHLRHGGRVVVHAVDPT